MNIACSLQHDSREGARAKRVPFVDRREDSPELPDDPGEERDACPPRRVNLQACPPMAGGDDFPLLQSAIELDGDGAVAYYPHEERESST